MGETCLLWEASVEPVTSIGIRLIKLRTGIVLSNHGGAFKEYRTPLNFGVAPILGNGKQIVSWIPAFILKIIFGKRNVEILKSATVSNKKIKAMGFTFLYPNIEAAIEELIRK